MNIRDYNSVVGFVASKGFRMSASAYNYKPNPLQIVTCRKCLYTTSLFLDHLVCPNCMKDPYHSSFEEMVASYIKSKSISVTQNYKMYVSDKNYFIDIDVYLPDYGIAFECNGVAWHNETIVHPSYHRFKTITCLKNGIELYHLWDYWDHDYIFSVVDLAINHKVLYSQDLYVVNKLYVSRDISPRIDSSLCDYGLTFVCENPPKPLYWKSPKVVESQIPESLRELFREKSIVRLHNHSIDLTYCGIYRCYDSGTLVYYTSQLQSDTLQKQQSL